MATASEERALIDRAQAGEEDAFEQIVAMHADRVYGALRRFGLDPGEADDVAQEVFLRAWRSIDRFQGRAQLSTWLYRIAFNEAQRRLARNASATLGTDPGGEDRLRSAQGPPDEGPEARLEGRELTAMVERALRELPDEWRAAVVLRDLEGLSTAEAARAVGVREAAFKSRLHRGRMQLRALLEPYLEAG
ncbi:MAG TPA: sigma-70 family RNA polymerase sigma factor [Solirubrobacteraceae bacterium]|nr:sigma-70 family RNA polymerase sigma factor [Solirubrobacteraceae bacterium]